MSTVASQHTLANKNALITRIRHGVIGRNAQINTPFGKRRLTYADYTASGRSLDFIETAILQHVLPFYANTHTEANATGQQTTSFREQARLKIGDAVNANHDDLVLFCGSGATSAVNTLISQLGLRQISPSEKAQVCILIGPYEHHSNELPWRELGVEIIRIPEANTGGVCLVSLARRLQNNQGRRLIGSFSAASNVTGIVCDQDAITALLHRYNALACWDFAAAAPYIALDMNPPGAVMLAKDAIFFSTHKFIGGPSTPGMLIVKKRIIQNMVPSVVGGGTVSFVTPHDHTFLAISERREEGGTPSIIEAIRAGLVFQLKQDVGANVIQAREHRLAELIDKRWHNHPSIQLLGKPQSARLSITALRITTDFGYLHHGFITVLLNDMFGIQVRGGCSCAGPYGHQLLHIDTAQSVRIQQALQDQEKLVKPGWVRFNLNYFLTDADAKFILAAIEFVAEHGITILPYYAYDQNLDVWRFQNRATTPLSLDSIMKIQPAQGVRVQNVLPQDQDIDQDIDIDIEEQENYFHQAKSIVKKCLDGEYELQQQPFNATYNDIKDFVLVQDLETLDKLAAPAT